MPNLWREEMRVIRAIKAARGQDADDGISSLWWGIACMGGAMLWGLILPPSADARGHQRRAEATHGGA